jgi:hypothetical protein
MVGHSSEQSRKFRVTNERSRKASTLPLLRPNTKRTIQLKMDPTLQQIRSSLVSTLLAITQHPISLPSLPKPSPYPHLLPTELELLEEYTRLKHLEFEKTLAQSTLETILSISSNNDDDDDDDDEIAIDELERLQHQLSEARLKNQIKTRAVESILSTQPILDVAFPGATLSEPTGALNSRVLQYRDDLICAHGKLAETINQLKEREMELQIERTGVEEENRRMAERIRELAKKVQAIDVEEDADVKEARRKEEWRVRVLRGVLGGLVVGSGVDWARDEELAELVLACGEE